MPRWKIRLAPDVLLELQPKVNRWYRFEFRAVQCEGVTPALLTHSRSFWPKPWIVQSGRLYEIEGEAMILRFSGAAWSWEGFDEAARSRLKELTVTAFTDGRFATFSATRLFHPYCLICGKALTDPVSMARFIGPECAGTSSPHIHRLLQNAA